MWNSLQSVCHYQEGLELRRQHFVASTYLCDHTADQMLAVINSAVVCCLKSRRQRRHFPVVQLFQCGQGSENILRLKIVVSSRGSLLIC